MPVCQTPSESRTRCVVLLCTAAALADKIEKFWDMDQATFNASRGTEAFEKFLHFFHTQLCGTASGLTTTMTKVQQMLESISANMLSQQLIVLKGFD